MSVNDFRTEPTSDIFEVKPGPNEYSSTFIFGNEDHTLGNALRYIIAQDKDTDFVGYSVPHPYEPKMNLRLQTKESSGNSAVKVLKKGLKELEETANILDDVFIAAMNEHLKQRV